LAKTAKTFHVVLAEKIQNCFKTVLIPLCWSQSQSINQ